MEKRRHPDNRRSSDMPFLTDVQYPALNTGAL